MRIYGPSEIALELHLLSHPKKHKSPERPTVLITGVAGYIGSHTALAFMEAGWRVVGVDNLSIGQRNAVPEGVEFIELDCESKEMAEKLSKDPPLAAVHFAGRIRVDESIALPAQYYDANFCTAGKFFNSAQEAGVQNVVFSSTAAVYGECGTEPISETAAFDPKSPYGRSKLAAEWLLRDISQATSLRHVILRYFNVAGADAGQRAGPRKDATHLIKAVSEAAVGLREALIVNGDDYDTPDGTCVRDFIHVTDLANAHVAAVEYLVKGGTSRTLNCGYGTGFSVREVIERGLSWADTSFKVSIGPRRDGDPASVVADATALREHLGWKPQHNDLDAILKSAIDWERNSQRNLDPSLQSKTNETAQHSRRQKMLTK